jgi:hypothetical protein
MASKHSLFSEPSCAKKIDRIIDVLERKFLRILQNGEDSFSGKKVSQGNFFGFEVHRSIR